MISRQILGYTGLQFFIKKISKLHIFSDLLHTLCHPDYLKLLFEVACYW